jgi:hypothetical protein
VLASVEGAIKTLLEKGKHVLMKDGKEIFRGTEEEVNAIAEKLKGMSDDVARKYFEDLTIRLKKIRKFNFKTKRIEEKYIGEELTDLEGLKDITSLSLKNENRWCWPYSVKYLDEIERIKYKVTIKDGKLYNQKNDLIDTLDTSTLSFKSQKAIFVMDRDGTVFLSNFFEPKYFHHSSFLAGKPVCAAGEVKVIAGEIIEVNIASGHYKPSFELNKQFLQLLEKEYNIKNVNLINEH